MNWLFDVFDTQKRHLDEPLLDCQTCQANAPLTRTEAEYSAQAGKCCRFSPFWSSFAAGAFLKKNQNFSNLFHNRTPLFTVFGVLHPLEERLNPSNICQFYSPLGSCKIWEHRPATCYTFFCTSQRTLGKKYYEQLEDLLLVFEAQLLKNWFFEDKKNWNLEDKAHKQDWEMWIAYMEKKPSLKSLPPHLLFADQKQAEEHYLKCYEWFIKSVKKSPLSIDFQNNWQNWLLEYQSL